MDGEIFLKLISFGDELTLNPYVDQLAKSLNMSPVQKGAEDTSNEKIFNDVNKFICEKSVFINDLTLQPIYPTETFLLIGWTNTCRRSVYWKDTYFTFRPDKRDYVDNGINALHKFEETLFNPVLLSDQWLTTALALQWSLSALGIKYFMYNTQDCILYNTHNKDKLKSLDPHTYYNPVNIKSSMKYYLENRGLDITTEHGNEVWATFLYNKIKNGLNL